MRSPTWWSVLGAAGLCAGAMAMSACSHGSASRLGTVRASGTVRLDGSTLPDGSVHRLGADDEVAVVDGAAVVSLSTGGQLELRRGSIVRFAPGPELVTGDVLVESGARGPVSVASPVGPVVITGKTRIRRSMGVEIGSYQGRASVGARPALTVMALEQAALGNGVAAPVAVPLHLDAADAWDQRILGTAIALTTQLDSQSRYVTANAEPALGATTAFYRSVVRQLAAVPSFDDVLLRSAAGDPAMTPPPGDGLVGASIALAGTGPFPDRWHAIFGLRQRGAQWGIVALDERADASIILSLVAAAVDQVALPATAPAPPPSPARTPTSSVATSPPPTTGPAPTSPTTGPTRPPALPVSPVTPPTSEPPAPPAGAHVVPGLPALAPVVDPIVNLILALLPHN